jgi:hypothetical protein
LTELPVSCSLNERELAERRAGILADLRARRREARWLLNGASFRFAADPAMLAALAEFIQLESKCCPFLRFRLTVEPGGGPVWLELTGPEGTREFLQAELGERKG